MRSLAGLMLVLLLAAACGGDGGGDVATEVSGAPLAGGSLGIESTWQWQIQGNVNATYDVDVYDIDLFDVPVDTIRQLQDDGRLVVCYFSAGSAEDFRPDFNRFGAGDLGEPLDGFADERFVDIRSDDVRSVMSDRLDLAVEKGCDGVEPDNVAAFDDDTGFGFDADDQLDFNRFLADEAHERDLLVGLKDDLSQIPDLVASFDFAVNEQCFEFDECDVYAPFISAGRPVFNAEYSDDAVGDPEAVCTRARAADLRTLILSVELDDSSRFSCD